MLRRVNRHLRDLPQGDYDAVVKEHLATRALGARAASEERAALDPATCAAALRWNAMVRDVIVGSGVELVGDLSDLPVAPTPQGLDRVRDHQPVPTTDQLLAAARDGVECMRGLVGRQRRRLRRPGAAEPVVTVAGVDPDRWVDGPEPTEAAARELAQLCRAAVTLHERLRGTSRGLA